MSYQKLSYQKLDLSHFEICCSAFSDIVSVHYIQTPLHYAAISRDVLSIELLLLHDASVTALDHHGNTPIHLATKHKAPQCLRIMLAYEMQKNNSRCPSVNIINYDGKSGKEPRPYNHGQTRARIIGNLNLCSRLYGPQVIF